MTRTLALVLVPLSVLPSFRLSAQDTSAIDRGVRIGIVHRAGVRPGVGVLPGRAQALDSIRAIIARDLDYSDRFELITLPSGDSIRVTAAPPPSATAGRPGAATGKATGAGGGAAATSLNYPLYQALGADFAVAIGNRARNSRRMPPAAPPGPRTTARRRPAAAPRGGGAPG